MVDPENPDIDVDLLMREIRAEIAGRMARASMPDQRPFNAALSRPINDSAGLLERVMLRRLPETSGTLPRKREYALSDFVDFHDEDFIRNAYRGILGREPDAEGGSRFLGKLRSGGLAKVEILGRIRFSPEGRAAAVPVRGLLLPFGMCTLRRVPILGHVLGMVEFILRLPNIARNQERLENVVFFHQLEARRGVNAIVAEIEAALQRVQERSAERVDSIDQRKADRATLDAIVAELRAALTALERDKAD